MADTRASRRLHPGWWTLVLLAVVIAAIVADVMRCSPARFSRYVPVTLTSDRSGLVMETGAKVKLRGVEVGRVAAISRRQTTRSA